jgi:outer membrane protein TolC
MLPAWRVHVHGKEETSTLRFARDGLRTLGMLLALVTSTVASPAELSAGETAPSPGDTPPPLTAAADFHAFDPQLTELTTSLLENHPRILAARTEARSRVERIPQAKALPDMHFSYRYFARTPETRVGPQRHVVEVSQGLPWGGKREHQAERAELDAEAAAWAVRDLERKLVAELKRAYFDAAYLQEALIVNDEERALLLRFEQIALKRYETGEGIQQHVVKVQTDISRLSDRETRLRRQFDVALRKIAELTGDPSADPRLDTIDLHRRVPASDLAAIETAPLSDHPRARAARSRIDADAATARRRSLDTRPDFRLGLGYTWVGDREDLAGVVNPPEDNGKDVVALTVGVNLPLQRKKTRAAVAEAEQMRRSSEYALLDTRDRLRFEIQEALLRARSVEERAELHEEVIVPQAGEALASAEAAYVTNRLDLLDLLDAERVLFQARLTYHRLIADLWTALADLEYALGRPFPEDPTDPATVASIDAPDDGGAER